MTPLANRPAFPLPLVKDAMGNLRTVMSSLEEGLSDASGMTLREYYAGLALQGILANPRVTEHGSTISNKFGSNWRSKFALEIADELIAELEKAQ